MGSAVVTSETRNEDGILAQRLSGRSRHQQAPEPRVPAGSGLIGTAVDAIADRQVVEQSDLDRALRTARSITICGIAPRSLVEAMQRVAKQLNDEGSVPPWRRITVVTPADALVFATAGNARLGSVVQQWQSALNGIRNCVRQVIADGEQATGAGPGLELSFIGIGHLFLEVVLLIEDRDSGRESLWASVGPSLARDDSTYLVEPPGTVLFNKISSTVHQLIQAGKPIVTRQLDISPEGLEESLRESQFLGLPRIEVRSLQHFGTPVPPPSCTPTAITVLRSASAGRPVVLLKRRTRFTDADDFDKLSLLSGRVLEEDLAGALGVPLFTDRRSDAAIDGMWKMHGRPERLIVPLDAFIRAAQRDVFVSSGLDISSDRFTHRGCQFVEREEPGVFLFFCIFDVALHRHSHEDELELAEAWNTEQLQRVDQELLYSPKHKPELNRLLLRRQQWLEQNVFGKSFDFLEERNAATAGMRQDGFDPLGRRRR